MHVLYNGQKQNTTENYIVGIQIIIAVHSIIICIVGKQTQVTKQKYLVNKDFCFKTSVRGTPYMYLTVNLSYCSNIVVN